MAPIPATVIEQVTQALRERLARRAFQRSLSQGPAELARQDERLRQDLAQLRGLAR